MGFLQGKNISDAWQDYKARWRRNYTDPTEDAERRARFERALQYIQQYNSNATRGPYDAFVSRDRRYRDVRAGCRTLSFTSPGDKKQRASLRLVFTTHNYQQLSRR